MVALVVGVGIGYSGIAGNAMTKTERTTSSATLTTVVTSHEATVLTSTELRTTTSVQIQNVTQTSTLTSTTAITDWTGLQLLSSQPGCMWSEGGQSGAFPCLSSNLTDVVLFNCAAAAKTPQGCTQRVNVTGSSNLSFTVTVWYPYKNSTWPFWANCKYTTPSVPNSALTIAYCIDVSSGAFYIAVPDFGFV